MKNSRELTMKALENANNLIDEIKNGPKHGKRRALLRLEARAGHLMVAIAKQGEKPTFPNKAKTVAPAKAEKVRKGHVFNKASIAKPSDELDMQAYARRCREEQKQADDAEAFRKLCESVDVALGDMDVTEADMKATKEDRQKAANDARKASMERAEGVLVLRPSGIWARRSIKKAKESAKWIRLLMDEKEAHEQHLRYLNLLPTDAKAKYEAEAKAEAEFQAWWAEFSTKWSTDDMDEARRVYREWLASKDVKSYFTSDEKAWDITRRRIANARAIDADKDVKPAEESAKVFCDELIAVEKMLDKPWDELAELGCKALYQALDIRNAAISDLEDQIFESRDKITYLLDDLLKIQPAAYDQFMEIVREDIRPVVKELKIQLAEVKAERRLIIAAIASVKKTATPAELGLINARGQICSKKAKAPKQVEGRTFVPLDKPEMKGFSLMAFVTEFVFSQLSKEDRKKIVALAMKWQKLVNEEASDDDVAAARSEVRKAFKAAHEKASKMLDNGECFVADASRCVVNNARQSQLVDVIGVPYGKETDMIVSIEHSMANFLPPVVKEALDEDPVKAQANIDGLETEFLNILTQNGLIIEFKTKNGNVRRTHYRFWNANNSALKVGKCYMLSDAAYETAKTAAQAGMTDEEFEQIPTNGSDMLKWWSYATTPGCPLTYIDETGKEQFITVNDVLIVDSIELKRVFKNVLEYDKDGNKVLKKFAEVPRTAYDGQLFFMVPIPSQQIRGGMSFKGYGVCCAYEDGTTIVDEIAAREGRVIPETIRDLDGVDREWRKYKVICTKDCWKWAGWGMSYDEYCDRMNRLAKDNPFVNLLYTARIADATEESKRHLTRQSTQQFPFMSQMCIDRLVEKSVNKVNRLRTREGVIRKLAELDKPEEERSAFAHLIEACPEFLDNDLIRRYVEDVFNREVAEAAVRPEVDGIYPYIAEDPVAFFKIVFWGENPDKLGLGYLNKDEVNIPEAGEGKEMYLVRYPNNYLCGMVARNHNDNIYRCVGNTMILSIDGYWLIRADGDVDGDEMCAIFDTVVIEEMKKTIKHLNPPLIVFPHPKTAKTILKGHEVRAYALARAMVIANKFGPAVGQNSNMATKFMAQAANWRMEVGYAINARDKDAEKKARKCLKLALDNAIIAHIAAIIAIDLAKTGEMPAWLQTKLDEIRKFAGKKMPWNQRFCRDNKVTPWFNSEYWDGNTKEESKGVVDLIARTVVNKTDAYNYTAPMGNDFDINSIMPNKEGLYRQGSDGRLQDRHLATLDARNFMKENTEGDNESKLLKTLHDEDETQTVGFAEMMRFFWRNQAALMYRFVDNGEDSYKNAAEVKDYQAAVRDIMVTFGSYCGNDKFRSLSPEAQAKSNVWKAMELAFGKNAIGKKVKEQVRKNHPDATKEELEALYAANDEIQSARASYAIFNAKVFAYDLYRMVCEKKEIVDIWNGREKKADAELEPATRDVDAEYAADMADWTANCAA